MRDEDMQGAVLHARGWLEDPGAPNPGSDEVDDIATRFATALLAAHADNERMRGVYQAALQWRDARCSNRGAGMYNECEHGHLDTCQRTLVRRVLSTAIDEARAGGEGK